MVAWYVAGLVVLGSMVGTMAAVGLLGAWLFFILGDPGTCDKTSLFLGVNNLSDAGMALATLPLKLVSSLLTRAYNSWVPILLLAALALLVTYESGPARAATRRSRTRSTPPTRGSACRSRSTPASASCRAAASL